MHSVSAERPSSARILFFIFTKIFPQKRMSTPPETSSAGGFSPADLVDPTWWRALFDQVVVFAAQNPGTFLYYVLLALTPLFLASALLSWKLAKHLEKDEKEKKRKAKREAGIAKARSNAATAAGDKSSASSSPSSKTTPQPKGSNKGRQKGNKRD